MIDLQHVLHGADELGVALGRDAPALFQPKPAPLQNGGLSSFFSASCAPSLGGCSPLSRTPPAGPTIISASNGPGLPAVPRRPAQSSGLPQRHPVSLAGGVVAPYAPRPLRSLPPRNGGVSVPLWRWRSRGTGQPLRPSGLRLSALHRSATEPALVKTGDACMGLLVRCCPSPRHQVLEFPPLLHIQLHPVLLGWHSHPPTTQSTWHSPR